MLKHNPQSEGILEMRPWEVIWAQYGVYAFIKRGRQYNLCVLNGDVNMEGHVSTSSGRELAKNSTRLKP